MTSRRATMAVLALVVVAGCTAPINGTPEPGIEVVGGSLPVDADVVFDRVAELMDAEVQRPDAVRVIASRELNATGGGGISTVPAFFEAVDVDVDPGEGLNASERASLENGATSLTVGTVTILLGSNESTTVHYVLAHEFAHYVQAARGRAGQLRRNLSDTTDANAVFRSLLEGAAVYTTNAYIRRHIGGGLTNSQLYFDLRKRLAPGSYQRFTNAMYIHGWRYVASRAIAPDATDPIYRHPPRTTEQVIHRLTPTAEPPVPLSVSVETGGYRRIGTDRLGELFLRTFLQNGLGTARASRAAAGWGNDTLRTYRPVDGGDPGYAWVLRFDDANNGTAFADALRDSLDEQGNRTDGVWRLRDSGVLLDLRTVSPRTSVFLVGNGPFVRNTSVDGSGRSVRIDLP